MESVFVFACSLKHIACGEQKDKVTQNHYLCNPNLLEDTMAALQFTLQHTDEQSKARAGHIVTDHGDIPTPIFMPVGTVGSVKAVSQQQLKEEIDAQIILGNTYHLFLRPGTDVLQKAGGLHQFKK
jgi:hypothetical protein